MNHHCKISHSPLFVHEPPNNENSFVIKTINNFELILILEYDKQANEYNFSIGPLECSINGRLMFLASYSPYVGCS